MKIIFTYFVLTILTQLTYGQGIEPINTDRPDQSDGTYILTANKFQLETGLIFSQSNNQLTDIAQSTMLRYGVSKKLEVRLLINAGFNSADAFKTKNFGLSPVSMSAKRSLCKQKGMWPAITAVGYLKLPFTASKTYQIDYFAPAFLFAFQNDFTEKLSLGYNAGITWDGVERQNSYEATVSLSYSLSGKFSMFGEYFAMFTKIDSPSHNVDFGTQYLINSSLQIDLATGSSLFNNSQSVFETLGISYRFK